MTLTFLHDHDARYPAGLGQYLAQNTPKTICAIGDLNVLRNKKIALFCSSKCPGDLIIKTYDLSKKWRDEGNIVVSGFHSPMEQECLTILLRGKQPIILCPARSIEGMQLKKEYINPLGEGRLLILSAANKKDCRITSATSQARNRFVAALADEIFITHAETSGKTTELAKEVMAWRKPVFSFASNSNTHLLEMGVRPIIQEES